MKVKKAIEILKTMPENLPVIARSSHTEKIGAIENISFLSDREVFGEDKESEDAGIFRKLINKILSKEEKPAGDDRIRILELKTTMYKTLTVRKFIGLLKKHDDNLELYYNNGIYGGNFSILNFDRVKSIRKVKCRKFTKNFHDSMDHTDYTSEVWGIVEKNGKEMVYLE